MTTNKKNTNNGFENINKFGISKIPQETLNSIWRGDELSKEDRDMANHIFSNSIKCELLEPVLNHLRSISSNIPKLDISIIQHHLIVNNNNKKGKKKPSKKTIVNKKSNKKRSSSRKKIVDGDDDDEMEDEEQEEDQEEEEEQEYDENESKSEQLIEEEEEQIQQSNQFIEFLESNEISVQNLSAVLYFLITSVTVKDTEVRFNAASIYMYMIVLIRKSFHPFIFRSVMKLLSTINKPTTTTTPSNTTTTTTSKSEKKDSKKGQEEDYEDKEEDEEEEEEEEEEKEEKGKKVDNSKKNKEIWIKKAIDLLKDLEWTFYRFSMVSFSEPLANAIESISCLTHCQNFIENNSSTSSKKRKSSSSLSSNEKKVIDLSFDVLYILTEENRHGPLSIVLPMLLKEFINTLTLNPGKVIPATVPKYLVVDRDRVLEFIKDQLLLNPNTHEQIHILLQHICMRIVDRTEYRNNTAISISELFQSLSTPKRFINFFLTYSKNSKSHFRAFSIDVSILLFLKFENINNFSDDEKQVLIEQLLSILVDRSSDKVSSVRSKALSNLSTLLEPDSPLFELIKDHLKNVFTLDHYDSNSSNKNNNNNNDHMVDSDDEEQHQQNQHLSNKKKPSLLSFLSKRSEDEKSAVRKSALQVLEVVSVQNGATRAILNILLKKCQDPSPLVRKQVISTLSNLMKVYKNDLLIVDFWRKAVIPLITDKEQTIMDKSLDSINEVLFGSILNSKENKFIWKLLNDISIEMKPYLHKICGLMSSKKMITPQLIKSIQSIIKESKDENISGGWTLFSEIAYCCPDKLDQNLIIGAWNKLKEQVDDRLLTKEQRDQKVLLLGSVLTVIETLSSILPIDIAKALFNEIYSKVKQFTFDPNITQLFIIILVKLTTKIFKSDGASNSKINGAIADWTKNILSICDEQLSIFALPNLLTTTTTKKDEDGGTVSTYKENQTEEKLALYLFTIGEIIQIPQARIPSRLKTVVQALIAPTLSTIYKQNSNNNTDDDTVSIIQDDKPIPTAIRAHAFITLGKLCLGDDRLAKKCIATFAKELEISESSIIRNNVMVVMCDLCIRYTQLVDNYIPNIAMCLRDPSELVRRQTLVLLTRLLQEDYVKWRGSLFFRFVEALVDPSPVVKQFANYCLMNVLQMKYGTNIQSAPGAAGASSGGAAGAANNIGNKDHQGNVFHTHFLETIFVLNNCKAHPNYNQVSANPTFSLINRNVNGGNNINNINNNNNQFSHHGQENFEKRMSIYSIFLNNMRDDHRFITLNRLCKDILMEVSEERLSIDECYGVIYDTLSILACKEIKLQSANSLKQQISDQNAESEENQDPNAAQLAKNQEASLKLLTSVSKTATIEVIVPMLVELKTLFERKRSNLTRLVVVLFRELNKDYKKEMEQFYVSHRQLQKEIEYDIKNLNKKQIQSPSKLLLSNNNSNNNNNPSTPKSVIARRFSVGSNSNNNMTGSPSIDNGGGNTVAPTSITKPDLTNFVVPQVRTPRRISIATTTPTSILKPFSQQGLGRLSITPMKPSSPQVSSNQKQPLQLTVTPLKQLMNEISSTIISSGGGSSGNSMAKKGSNNLFGSNLQNNNNNNNSSSSPSLINATPLRSAMRHSIAGFPSSALKSNNNSSSITEQSPFKSLRFNDEPPKITTIPFSIPIRLPIEALNSLNADIVLPNIENPPTPKKWNIQEDEKQQKKEQPQQQTEEEDEEAPILSKRSRDNRKLQPSFIESEDEQVREEQEEVSKTKRGRKPTTPTKTTVNKRSTINKQQEQQEEEEIIKPKRGGKPTTTKKLTTNTNNKRNDDSQDEDDKIEQEEEEDNQEDHEDEKIVQVKKRGKTSSSKTTTTRRTKK